MKKFQTTITIFLLLLLIPATFMGGRLSDFKDDLKNSESSSSGSSSDKSSTSDDSDDKISGPFTMIFDAIFGDLFRYNMSQTYSGFPYQSSKIPFNLHVATNKQQPPGRKKWTIATTVEYQHFDDQLKALVLDLDLTFAGGFKLKVSSNSLQEEMFNYKDSLTLLNFMFGLDLITISNFICGMRLGFQKVTDLDLNMFAANIYIQIHTGKPFVLDFQFTVAFYNDVSTEEFTMRLGFLVGMYDLGIGYSWLRLGSASVIDGVNLSVRFWM